MFVIFLLVLAALCLVFFLGFQTGKKRLSAQQLEAQRQALGEAWQQGYEAAREHWNTSATARRETSTTGTAPSTAPSRADLPTTAPPTQPVAKFEPAATAPAQPVGSVAMQGLGPATGQEPAAAARVLAPQVTPSATPTAHKPKLLGRERELRNINLTLYVAALLLVSAGALFLSFALAPVAKLAGLCLVSVAFYAAGLWVYRTKPALRPAAGAFAGTGLALLPLCAVATYNTLEISATAVWLAFSLLGTLAFGFATLQLRSRVLAWLAVLILVSTAMSSGAALGQGVLNYLLGLLALSIILQLVVLRSVWVRRSLFHQALSATLRLLPPLVFLASLVMFEALGSRQFFWIFVLLAGHYLLATALDPVHQLLTFSAARLLFIMALIAGLNYTDVGAVPSAVVLAYVLAFQAVLVARRGALYGALLGATAQWQVLERIVLWSATWFCITWMYAQLLADERNSWWVTLLVIPSLLLAQLWVLRANQWVEAVAVLCFATLANVEPWQHWWTVLPALLLGVIALSVGMRQQGAQLRRVSGHIRWILLLGVGAKTGQCLHLLSGGRQGPELLVPTMVGLSTVALILLLRNHRQLRSGLGQADRRWHQLARTGATLALLLIVVATLRMLFTERSGSFGFLGMDSGIWLVALLLATLFATGFAGWRNDRFPTPDPALRIMVLLALTLAFLLAMIQPLWLLAPLVAALNMAFLGASLPTVRGTGWAIAYAGLIQLHFTATIWWSMSQFNLDFHGQIAVLLLSISLPQLARLMLAADHGDRLRPELGWIAVGMLVAIPLAMFVYAANPGGVDRGTTVLSIVLWVVHGIAAHRAMRTTVYRQWLLLPVPAGACALLVGGTLALNTDTGWLREPLWTQGTALLGLALCVLAALGVELARRGRTGHGKIQLVAIALPLLALLLWSPHRGWLTLAVALGAIGAGLLLLTRKRAILSVPAAVLLMGGCVLGIFWWRGTQPVYSNSSVDFSWALALAAMLLLIAALLHGRFGTPVPQYPRSLAPAKTLEAAVAAGSRVYFAATLVAVALAGASLHLFNHAPAPLLIGAFMLAVAFLAARICEAPRPWAHHATDLLIVLYAGMLLRCLEVLLQPLTLSALLLYWAAVTALVAGRHVYMAHAALVRNWAIAAAGLASACEVATLRDKSPVVQILVLVFFAGVLVFGLYRAQRLFTWWAAIAITAAVIWFLRNYAILLLTLLAIALIVLAVRKLMKVEQRSKER